MQVERTTIDLDKYIDTTFFGERPHVRGRRVPVATLAYSSQSQNWDVPEVAYQYGLSEQEVLAALLYYEQHKTMIDTQETEYQALLDEMYRLYGEQH